MINALTFDIEDYFHVSNFSHFITQDDWSNYDYRVEHNTEKILGILSDYNIKATFFILGWVAQKSPSLVKKIQALGHEIASHGYSHNLIYSQSKEDFREDIKKSKKILEDLIAKQIIGYRAPSYSITKQSLWALDILQDEGYRYDSSVFPVFHSNYGIPGTDRFIHKIKDTLIEFPLSTHRLGGLNIPIAGGAYLRFMPFWLIKRGLRDLNRYGQPAIIYLHPWEVDHEQPRLIKRGARYLRQYFGLNKTIPKLIELIKSFKFSTVKDVLKAKQLIGEEF